MLCINYMIESGKVGNRVRNCRQYLLEGELTDAQIGLVGEKFKDGFSPENVGLPGFNSAKLAKLQSLENLPEEDREYLTRDCELDILEMNADDFYQRFLEV